MVNPSKWANLKSNFLKFHHRNQVIFGIEKARKMAYFRAFLALLSCRLSLAELRCATSCFETVFLALLHTRIAREEAGLLQDGAILGVDQQQGAGHAVTQSAGLTGHAAALDGGNDVDLAELLRSGEGLTDDHLQGLETEILVDVAAVDGDSAGAVLEEANAGDGGLSTAFCLSFRT